LIHDAKVEPPCELLLRARLVPDRAGADTQVIAHIPLSQLRAMPGARDLEDAWIRARLGEAAQHPEPAARHRLQRQHPLAHPPRRPAQGPQVRLAPMRPPRRLPAQNAA
jgi:hypothetical protein